MDWNNKEQVLAAVQQNGRALRYASDELRNDREVVLAAALIATQHRPNVAGILESVTIKNAVSAKINFDKQNPGISMLFNCPGKKVAVVQIDTDEEPEGIFDIQGQEDQLSLKIKSEYKPATLKTGKK